MRRFGPFLLERELGRGANAVVFLARREGDPGRYALKVHLGALDRESTIRHLLEAQITAELDHPGVVRVVDQGQADGRDYLLMEYCEGESLQERLRRGRLPWSEAVELVLGMCQAMAAAHARGVIHRDLKPANVLIEAASGRPRVIDFGLARDQALVRSLTESCVALGTPITMAPEQLRAEKDVDARADVYALGAILYHCLTGRPPFVSPTVVELQRQVFGVEPAPPSRWAKDVPPEVDQVCLRALAKAREGRPADAGALAEELEAVLAPAAPAEEGDGGSRAKLAALSGAALLSLLGLALAVLFAGLAAGVGRGPGPSEPAKSPPVASPSSAPAAVPEAAQAVATLLREVERRAHARASLGELLEVLDRAKAAARDDEALRWEVAYARAEAYRRRGDYRSALDVVPVHARGPLGPRARFVEALCLLRLGRRPEADERFDALYRDDPDGGSGLDARAIRLIGEEGDEWARTGKRAGDAPGADFHARLVGAYALLRLASKEAALEALERLRLDEPDDPHVHFVRAFVLSSAGDGPGSRAAYDEVLALTKPFRPIQALEGRAHTFMFERRWEEAAREFDGILADDPFRISALLWRGVVVLQLGRQEEALASWRTACLHRDPRTWEKELARLPEGFAPQLQRLAEQYPVRSGR
ncbi:MAG: protein kinase [Planctomycetota bacterium]